MTTYQSTEECFEDLCFRFASFEDRNKFADIFGIKQVTLASWNNRGFKAMGEKLVRIRVALELLGYSVSEWAVFDRNLYPLVQAVTYNLLSLEELTKELDYTTTSQLLQVFLNGRTMTKDRYEKALALAAKIDQEVSRGRINALSLISGIQLEMSCQPEASDSTEYWTSVPYPDLTVQEMILIFENLVKAMLPIARYFDNSPTEDRKVLRKAVGYEEIAEVTELLRGLSSEKYRESR